MPLPPSSLNPPTPDARALADGFRRIAGVDEAGRGPWAGPVVAAAVVLRTIPRGVRIDDSKRLTSRQRELACAAILEHADVGVGIVSHETIDQRNILQATFLAMQQAIHDLPSPPDMILVDGTMALPGVSPCQAIVGGDGLSPAIGCASIVAKVVRDRLMSFYHDLYPAYAFNRHKGYGTRLHAQRLSQFGPSFLHRSSFRPVREILDRGQGCNTGGSCRGAPSPSSRPSPGTQRSWVGEGSAAAPQASGPRRPQSQSDCGTSSACGLGRTIAVVGSGRPGNLRRATRHRYNSSDHDQALVQFDSM